MSDYLIQQIKAGQDGAIHHVSAINKSPIWWLDGVRQPDLPFEVVAVDVDATADGRVWVVFCEHVSGGAVLRRPDGTILSDAHGHKAIGYPAGAFGQAIACRGDKVCIYVRGEGHRPRENRCIVSVWDDVGLPVMDVARQRAYEVDYLPQIHHIGADDVPVMGGGPMPALTAGGLTLTGASEVIAADGRHVIGGSNGYVDAEHPDWPVEVWVQPDGTALMYVYETMDSPQPSRIAAIGASVAHALSGRGVPRVGDPIPWEPYVAPKPVAPRLRAAIDLRLPDAIDPLPPIYIGLVTDRPGMPGNCAWDGAPGETKPCTTTHDWAQLVKGKELLCGLWLSDKGARPDTVDAEIAFAKARGAAAVYLHEDDVTQRANVDQAAERVRAAGLLPIVGTNVNNGEAVRVADLRPDDAFGVTLNVRTFGKDYARMRDGIIGALRTVREQGGVVVFVYGWFDHAADEHESLDDRWPDLARYLRHIMAMVQTPTKPGTQPAAPTSPPITAQPRPEPKPAPKQSGNAKTWASVVAAFAGVVAWFKARQR